MSDRTFRDLDPTTRPTACDSVIGLVRTPVARPVMTQHWADVVFLHWPYEPDVVQRLLPTGVEVDRHDGSAWVGLVPFRMENLALPGLGPLPRIGTFPEVNVRTYVRSGGRRGVWFFSLDIDLVVPTLVARTVYQLPYCYGSTEHLRVGDIVTTRVRRRWPSASEPPGTELAVRTLGPAPDDHLNRFLTDRWGLIASTRRGRLLHAPVDHGPWPLHAAEVIHCDDRLVAAAGLPAPEGPPRALWSPGVDVRVGRPTRLTQ